MATPVWSHCSQDRMWSRTHDGEGLPDGVEVTGRRHGYLMVTASSPKVRKVLQSRGFGGCYLPSKAVEVFAAGLLGLPASRVETQLALGMLDGMLFELLDAEEAGANRPEALKVIVTRLTRPD